MLTALILIIGHFIVILGGGNRILQFMLMKINYIYKGLAIIFGKAIIQNYGLTPKKHMIVADKIFILQLEMEYG